MKVEREKALEHKKRMSRMMEDKENFVSKITAARSFIYEVKLMVVTSPPHTEFFLLKIFSCVMFHMEIINFYFLQ